MSYIKVENKNGTEDKTPPSGYTSWINFWEEKSGDVAIFCKVQGCGKTSDVGGHVIKSGEGGKEYIIPLCYDHNNAPDGEVFTTWEPGMVSVK